MPITLTKPSRGNRGTGRSPGHSADALTPDQQDLAASVFEMARRLASSFARRWPAMAEEYESAAMQAVCKAAARYDAPIHGDFADYAKGRIISAIRNAPRAANTPLGYRGHNGDPVPATISLDAPTGRDDNSGTLAELIPDPIAETDTDTDEPEDDMTAEAQRTTSKAVLDLVKRLPYKERIVIEEIYLNHDQPVSQVEIARRLKCHTNYVYKLHKQARERLRQMDTLGALAGVISQEGSPYFPKGDDGEAPGGATANGHVNGHASPHVNRIKGLLDPACRECGRPKGDRRKRNTNCQCRPGSVKPAAPAVSASTNPAPVKSSATGSLADALREVDAMRSILESLGSLPTRSAMRVLDWAKAQFEGLS